MKNKLIFYIISILLILNVNYLFSQQTNPIGDTNKDETITQTQTTNIEDLINIKLKEAKDYLAKANKAFEEGYYDEGYNYANKAKEIASEVDNLKIELSKKLSAESKIKNAKELIKEAEDKEANKYTPDELANAKTALLSAEGFYDEKKWDDSLEKANEAIAYAETCLQKIAEAKKKLEEAKTPKIVESHPFGKGYEGPYKIKTTYKVRLIPERRDCLWRIAEYKFIYGNPLKWPIIYKANKDQIKDPDLIYPGQVFKIPELNKKGEPIILLKNKSKQTNINTINEKDNNVKSNKKNVPANAGESKINSTGD